MSRLEKLIKYLGMSKVEFAEMLGITRIMLYYYLTFKNAPSLKIANKILKIAEENEFKLTVYDLVYPPKRKKSQDMHK